jgi:hypothetical protein
MGDSTFWNVTVPRVMSTYAITIFLILWVGFTVALIMNRECVNDELKSPVIIGLKSPFFIDRNVHCNILRLIPNA